TNQINEIEIDTDQANEIEVDTEQINKIEVDTNNLKTNEIESVNATLGKYYMKLCQQKSIYQKKTANNTIKPGTPVSIVLDYDTNPQI
ncbi:1978_t:CDS:2, partial [Cetraspora pellucida]